MKISLQNISYNNKFLPKNAQEKDNGNNFVSPQNATSSLDLISNYNRAGVSFNGKITDKYGEIKDKCQFYPQWFKFKSRLETAKKEDSLSIKLNTKTGTKILACTDIWNIELVERLCFDEENRNKNIFENGEDISNAVENLNPDNIDLAERLFFGDEVIFEDKKAAVGSLRYINKNNKALAEKLIFGKNEKYEQMVEEYNKYHSNSRITYIIDWEEKPYNDFLRRPFKEISPELFPRKDYLICNILCILQYHPEKIDLAETLCVGQSENGSDLFPYKEYITDILLNTKLENKELIKKICTTNFKLLNYAPIKFIQKTISALNEDNMAIAEKMLFGTKENGEPIIKDKKIVPACLSCLQQKSDVDKLTKYFDLMQKGEIREQDILCLLNDISLKEYQKAKEIYGEKKLYSIPDEVFVSSVKLANLYRKTNIQDLSNEEKKELLKKIMAEGSKNFEANKTIKNVFPLIPINFEEYNKIIQDLMSSVGIKVEKISEEENLELNKNLVSLATTLSSLSDDDFNNLSIIGKNLQVQCNNKAIENDLNKILDVFPELNSIVGKRQHGTHNFDVLKHSLKVMQKVTQNNNYKKLNDSDKKIILLASLFHDFSKTEGKIDEKHAENSASESFYILNKLNLSKQETNKLYSLIKHHEWLKTVNCAPRNEKEITIKTVAYNLHHSNLFEMSKMFTQADLKAVYNNDDFYYSYKTDFENASAKVEKQIKELKNTQPLLPITPFPSASRIKQAINKVYSNGRTNLPGIYQDEKGMVIIRYNEVENETWEKIGFPKGSISRGVAHTYKDYQDKKRSYDTGNIKFFVHGLRKENQLRNFDAFVLPDSDALLSVSYAERPESKFRFYKPQGVIIKTEAQNIHGGGSTDGGSGCKKTVDDFIENYAFPESIRHQDRTFVSELIKKDLKLTDRKYQELVVKNVDKPLCEIEPQSLQEKLIKSFAKINARPRSGERDYNEMYLSNPEVMGVYAYNDYREKPIVNVMAFIEKQEDFIKNYALEKDIPFVVFDNYGND